MKNKIKTLKNQKGTTLVEIMLSVALLAIIVTPLIGAVVSSVKNNTASKDKTEAVALAEEVMGKIKAQAVINTIAEVPYPTTPSGNLVPYYEVVLDDSGDVAPSTDTTYTYGIPADNNFDFELEINQGANTNDGILPNVNFYKIDNNGNKTNLALWQISSVATENLELKVEESGSDYNYYLDKKSSLAPQSILGSFRPKDANSIKLKVKYTNTAPSSAEQLKISTKIISNVNSIFKVYVINNEEANSGVRFINKGMTNFEVNYLDSNAFNYSAINGLYKINVIIKKNGTPIYQTSSYVKK